MGKVLFGEELAAGETEGLRIGVVPGELWDDCDLEVYTACRQAVEELREASAGTIAEVDFAGREHVLIASILVGSTEELAVMTPRRVAALGDDVSLVARALLRYRLLIPAVAIAKAHRWQEQLESGKYAFCEGNYITVGGMDDKVEVYGTEGRMNIDLTFSSPIQCYSRPGFEYAIEKTDTTKHWTWPAVDEFHNLGYVDQLANFVDCALAKKEPEFGIRGEDGVACVGIIDAAYRSAETVSVVKGMW